MNNQHRAGNSAAARRAALVDLDNILIDNATGRRISTPEAEALLRRVLARAGDTQYALAIAPRNSITTYGAVLAAVGLRWQICEQRPDAADRALCLAACDLVESGYGEIIVVSSDHYFSCLAMIARLTVVVPNGALVARDLKRSATVLAA